jgi:HTH-type transcriptional regulator / antitoxin HipB
MIHEQLKQARLISGMTIEEVAKKMRTHKPAISELENGKTNPSIKTLVKYCEAIGAKLEINITKN